LAVTRPFEPAILQANWAIRTSASNDDWQKPENRAFEETWKEQWELAASDWACRTSSEAGEWHIAEKYFDEYQN
jgi:hypothetical protein